MSKRKIRAKESEGGCKKCSDAADGSCVNAISRIPWANERADDQFTMIDRRYFWKRRDAGKTYRLIAISSNLQGGHVMEIPEARGLTGPINCHKAYKGRRRTKGASGC